MTISLNVLNHMGLNLYSNTPAVLAEVIANSWDADATEVKVNFDLNNKTITISDNGCGMNLDDVNSKYLYVGHQKRPPSGGSQEEFLTPKYKRRPMGRKGIGKLSLFSIANKFRVCTKVLGGEVEAFLMDADKIRDAMDIEDPSKTQSYEPDPIEPVERLQTTHGTIISISDLKKLRLTEASVVALRRRIARRFSVIGDTFSFSVTVNEIPVTLADRNYFHKARYIYQFGRDYSKLCTRLETDEQSNVTGLFNRPYVLDEQGHADESGCYRIKGWIAVAWKSNDLDGADQPDSDNLNKVTIVVRGKVAQENILQEFRLGGMITKYIFGEIEADFLDLDNYPDIATTGRQSISEDDQRYKALTQFIRSELKHIWSETNKLKEHAGLRNALATNPYLRRWYDDLRPPHLKQFAKKIFGDIDKAGIEETHRQEAYANGILLFEHLKMNHALDLLENIDISEVEEFLSYLRDVDALEAEHYRQIVEERLVIIRKLRDSVDEDARERVLQEYIFDHLFLLDPGWERATQFEDLEKRMERVLEANKKKLRVDIQFTKYRRVAAAHVVVELKRRSVKVSKTELEQQVRGYIDALREELQKSSKRIADLPIEAVCIVGDLPRGWDKELTRNQDETSLSLYGIRVVTYDELIDNAYDAYGKFIAAYQSKGDLRELMNQVREYEPPQEDNAS